jgi:hypothetical protein
MSFHVPGVDGTGANAGLVTTRDSNLEVRRLRTILRSVQTNLVSPIMVTNTIDSTGALIMNTSQTGVRQLDPRFTDARFDVEHQMFTISWDILRNPSGYQVPFTIPNFLPGPPPVVGPQIILPYFVLNNPGLGYDATNVQQTDIGGVPVGQEQAGFETFVAPEDGIYYVQLMVRFASEGGAARFTFTSDGVAIPDTVQVLSMPDNIVAPPGTSTNTNPFRTSVIAYLNMTKGEVLQTFGQFVQAGATDAPATVGVSNMVLRIVMLASL